jgi:cyanophycinase
MSPPALTRPAVALCAAATMLTAAPALGAGASQACETPCVGPVRGAVIAAGGGRLDPEIYETFLDLAGGSDARIVLIPTAGTEFGSQDGWTAIEELRRAGLPLERLEVLHTRSAAVADLEAFASPLDRATGVWFSGGRQHRLVDVYLDTETHRKLEALLVRGGVIGGNSAGASALASFLVRGGELGEAIIDTGRSRGFGFLRDIAIDQHLLARGREHQMFEVLDREPQLLGIGLNEGAGVVVSGDLAYVVGGRVAIYDVTDPLTLIPLSWLDPGEVYDLGARRVVLRRLVAPGLGEAPQRTPAP